MTTSTRRRARLVDGRLAATLATLAVIAVTILAVTIVNLHHKGFATRSAVTTSSPKTSITYPVILPDGYQPPTGLAADPDDAGVWYFAQGGTADQPEETLFHWVRSSGAVAAYPIDPSVTENKAGDLTPIAITRSGIAWLGLNSELVEVDPDAAVQSAITTLPLPDVSVGDPASGLPHLPPGASSPVESLAVDDAGQVVVGRVFATELQMVDTVTGAVSDLQLPQGQALAGLGARDLIGGAGSAGVGAVLYGSDATHDFAELNNDGSWSIVTSPCDAYGATASGDDLVIRGPDCLALQPGISGGSILPLGTLGPPTCAIALSATQLLVCTNAGVDVENSQTGVQSGLSLGSIAPGPSRGGTRAGDTPVPVVPTLLTSGGTGTAYFVPSFGKNQVGMITEENAS